MSKPRDDKTYWLDDPRNIKKIVWLLCGLCALLFAADLIHHRHAVFEWEGWIGFYSVFGFIAGIAIVLGAKELRKLIKRDEDYYDR